MYYSKRIEIFDRSRGYKIDKVKKRQFMAAIKYLKY